MRKIIMRKIQNKFLELVVRAKEIEDFLPSDSSILKCSRSV